MKTDSHDSYQFAKKASSRARSSARRGLQFPLALQLVTLGLHVDEVSVYVLMEDLLCGNFGQNSALAWHQNAFSSRFSCRLATTPGKSVIAMWINKFREHGAIYNSNSEDLGDTEAFREFKMHRNPRKHHQSDGIRDQRSRKSKDQKISLQIILTTSAESCRRAW